VPVPRKKLLELARSEVLQRSQQEDLLSSFMIGSAVQGQPFLGDTADIDLVLIHPTEQKQFREIIRLSHQVHLDILHYGQHIFSQPRTLRIDPWLGPAIAEPGYLYDPEHFFERVQASVRGQFYRPDFSLQRARGFLDLAGQHQALMLISNRWQQHYLHAITHAANAILSCEGKPESGRGWLKALRQRLQTLDDVETYNGILQLCGIWESPEWDFAALCAAFQRSCKKALQRSGMQPAARGRFEYLSGGVEGLLAMQEQRAAAWLLLTSWEKLLHQDGAAASQDESAPFKTLLEHAQLTDQSREQRKDVLARYLKYIETRVLEWGQRAGA